MKIDTSYGDELLKGYAVMVKKISNKELKIMCDFAQKQVSICKDEFDRREKEKEDDIKK